MPFKSTVWSCCEAFHRLCSVDWWRITSLARLRLWVTGDGENRIRPHHWDGHRCSLFSLSSLSSLSIFRSIHELIHSFFRAERRPPAFPNQSCMQVSMQLPLINIRPDSSSNPPELASSFHATVDAFCWTFLFLFHPGSVSLFLPFPLCWPQPRTLIYREEGEQHVRLRSC